MHNMVTLTMLAIRYVCYLLYKQRTNPIVTVAFPPNFYRPFCSQHLYNTFPKIFTQVSIDYLIYNSKKNYLHNETAISNYTLVVTQLAMA